MNVVQGKEATVTAWRGRQTTCRLSGENLEREVVKGKRLMVKQVATIAWTRPGHKTVAAMELLWSEKRSEENEGAVGGSLCQAGATTEIPGSCTFQPTRRNGCDAHGENINTASSPARYLRYLPYSKHRLLQELRYVGYDKTAGSHKFAGSSSMMDTPSTV